MLNQLVYSLEGVAEFVLIHFDSNSNLNSNYFHCGTFITSRNYPNSGLPGKPSAEPRSHMGQSEVTNGKNCRIFDIEFATKKFSKKISGNSDFENFRTFFRKYFLLANSKSKIEHDNSDRWVRQRPRDWP